MHSDLEKRCYVTAQPISAATVETAMVDPASGAVFLFVGKVRNHHAGREVVGITYEAYQSMAEKVLDAIATKAREKFAVHEIRIVHRIGYLKVGEVSVCVAVSAAHRQEAFMAAHYCIEELKREVPIWKKEHYAVGESRWLGVPVDA